MNKTRLTILFLLILCFKQLFTRLAIWLKLNIWFILLCLLIVTIPAAKAALYHTVKEELRDPFEVHINAREEFRKAFFQLFGRSLVLSIINIIVLLLIIAAFIFWIGIEPRILRYLSIIILYFAVMWWLCQPFLFPVLVDNPKMPLQKVIKNVIRLALSQPFYALMVTFMITLTNLVGLIFLGPILLIVPAFNALLSTQAYWTMTGVEIPDLIDPVAYAYQQDKLNPENNPVQSNFPTK